MASAWRKIYKVTLEANERAALRALVDSDQDSKKRCKRAYILLLADQDRALVVAAVMGILRIV